MWPVLCSIKANLQTQGLCRDGEGMLKSQSRKSCRDRVAPKYAGEVAMSLLGRRVQYRAAGD